MAGKRRGEQYNPFTPIHRGKTRPELSCVRLKHDFADNDAEIIPKGTIGTIVHIWTAGMYCVEFCNYDPMKEYASHSCTSVVNVLEKDIEDVPDDQHSNPE